MSSQCPFCLGAFEPTRKNQKFCSKECQVNNNKSWNKDARFTREPNCTCEGCGCKFYRASGVKSKHTYCSRVCQNRAQSERKKIPAAFTNCQCEQCSQPFYKKGSKLQRDTIHFCSIGCRQSYWEEHNSVVVTCDVCEASFKRTRSSALKSSNNFCSVSCQVTWQRRYYLDTNCAACGKSIVKDKTSQAQNKTGMFFCDNKCANSMLIVKERNPNYKGIADITSALRAYYASYQRGHAFARAEKMCSHCGSLAQEIHHIYPMFKIIEDEIATNVEFDLATEAGRFGLVAKVIDNKGNVFNDEDNLIAVCKNCHDTIYHGSGWKSEYNDIDNQQPSQFALEGSETIETARYA